MLISNWTEFTKKDKYTVSNTILKQISILKQIKKTSIQLRYSKYNNTIFFISSDIRAMLFI